METARFLKIENFKIENKDIKFDNNFLSSTQKGKIYKNFVSFLNNHFKITTFTNALYEYMQTKLDLEKFESKQIFYEHYFKTANEYHSLKSKKSINTKLTFLKLFRELNFKKNEIGKVCIAFLKLEKNINNTDLDNALLTLFNEYLSLWEIEHEKAKKEKEEFYSEYANKILLEEKNVIEEKLRCLENELAQVKKDNKKKSSSPIIHKKQTDIFTYINN